jgi:hypothetical protein
MKFNTLPRRVAATGAVTALTAGALVGLTTTAAQAATVTVEYTCPTPNDVTPPLPVTLETDIPNLGGVAATGPFPAGSPVGANSVPGGVVNTFTISNATKQTLDGFGTTNIDFTDFAGQLGNSTVPADLPDVAVDGDLDQNADTTWSFVANGNNLAFNNPAAGTYDVLAPETFSFVATTAIGAVPITCTADSTPGSYGSQIEVVKNTSTTTVTSNSPVKKGAKAVITAKVSADFRKPTGKVTFKDGKKTIGTVKLKKGVAKLSKTLSKGKHTIKVSYPGDGYATSSTGKTTVTQK